MGLTGVKYSFDLAATFHPIEIKGEERTVIIDRATQSISFKKLISEPLSNSKIYVFTSRHHYIKARALALLAFGIHVEQSDDPNQWIVANSSIKLIEIKKGLIVMDSISDEMSPYKRDKIHDLCQEYCGRDMFILHHGVSPYETCIDSLGVKPSMIYNLDSSIKASEKKVRKL